MAQGEEAPLKSPMLPAPETLVRSVGVDLRESDEVAKDRSNSLKYCTNKIRSARYNALTFFPAALLVQYTKVGNVFWTLQAFLQTNKTIRTQNPGPIFLIVSLVLGIGIFKEWLSDHKRTVADRQTN